MNHPYVKHYNKDGVLTNPITTSYLSRDLNRKQRREPLQKRTASKRRRK